MAANQKRKEQREEIMRSVRGQVEYSVMQTIRTMRMLRLCKPYGRAHLDHERISARQLVERTVPLWRNARRIIFKEYNDLKKEQRRESKAKSKGFSRAGSGSSR